MSVRTTRKTYVPYIIDIILKARELIKLLSRCVHRFEQGTVREEITEGHRTGRKHIDRSQLAMEKVRRIALDRTKNAHPIYRT